MYMDSIKAEKFQAMKKYRKSQFLHNLLLHLLSGLACILFFSNPFWFPSLCSSMKHFFIISLPCIWSSFFNPKCLFIVVNVIVVFLIGESRLSRPNSSPGRDIYNEYMERSRSLKGVSVLTPQEKICQPQEKKVEVEKKAELKVVVNTAEDKQVNSKEENEELVEMKEVTLGGKEEKEVKVKEVIISEAEEANEEDRLGEEASEIVEEEEEEPYEEKEREIVEEEVGLPAEELNKRVEEFIARVNKQRWLEAQ